jgi:hypothetical protein
MPRQIGDTDVCKNCGDPIIFKGSYWEHIGTLPRHIAAPKPVILTTDDLQRLHPGKLIMVYSDRVDQLWGLTEEEVSVLDSGDALQIYVEN